MWRILNTHHRCDAWHTHTHMHARTLRIFIYIETVMVREFFFGCCCSSFYLSCVCVCRHRRWQSVLFSSRATTVGKEAEGWSRGGVEQLAAPSSFDTRRHQVMTFVAIYPLSLEICGKAAAEAAAAATRTLRYFFCVGVLCISSEASNMSCGGTGGVLKLS